MYLNLINLKKKKKYLEKIYLQIQYFKIIITLN